MRHASFLLLLSSAVLVIPAAAEDVVRIKCGQRGLTSLTYAGIEYVDPSGAGGLGFTGGGSLLRGADDKAFATTPTATKVDGDTVEQTYPWGTFRAAYRVDDADLSVEATLRNISGVGLVEWRANVLQLNHRLVFRPGGDPHGFSDTMQWTPSAEHAPHVYWWVDFAEPFADRAVKVMFADLTGTWNTGVNRVQSASGDRWPVCIGATSWEMAPAGRVQQNTVTVTVRFRRQDPERRRAADELHRRARSLEKAEEARKQDLKTPPKFDDDRLLDRSPQESRIDLDLEERPGAGKASVPEASLTEIQARAAAEQAAAWAAAAAAFQASMPSAVEVCVDGYEAWGRYNKRDAFWSDRRAIGAYFGCRDGVTSATNPNGWFKDPQGVDVTTADGRKAFAERLLAEIDRTVGVLQRAGAQGVIWWDLEGQRNPHPITYIGDPRVLDPGHPHHAAFAPELDTPVEYDGVTMPLADACFRRFKDAGLKTGVTIRPQTLTYSAPLSLDESRAGVEAARQRLDSARRTLAEVREDVDAVLLEDARAVEAAEKVVLQAEAELGGAQAALERAKLGPLPNGQGYGDESRSILDKARYARDRWGCTLFYVDSIPAHVGYWWMDEAARRMQDCLFMPEWATARSYRCSNQMSITDFTGYWRGVPAELQAAWPDAFCGMFHLDFGGMARNKAARQDFVVAVRRGNLPVFDCFYDNVAATTVISEVYREVGARHAPRAADVEVSGAPDAPLPVTLAAADEDAEPLSFAILGPPLNGTVSGIEKGSGVVTYTPARGWRGTDTFTYKATDPAGLSSNRGTVTVRVQ